MKRDEMYASVTAKIVEQLREGVLPWRHHLRDENILSPLSVPMNAKTKKPYKGVNVPLLWLADCSSPYWATEKTWNEMGGFVGTQMPVEIFFMSFTKITRRPFYKSYKVHNLDHVLGCDHLRVFPFANAGFECEPADNLFSSSGAKFVLSQQAWYDPLGDVVYCPSADYFESLIGYYTTKIHELVHWTGNSKRLNRTFGANRRAPEYAKEELVAELGTCFLCAALQIPERMEELPNHASYISKWHEQLSSDNQVFFLACKEAQKATEFLLNLAKFTCVHV
jgi:antirestriction protein ArdC